jgi:hypothetical protein
MGYLILSDTTWHADVLREWCNIMFRSSAQIRNTRTSSGRTPFWAGTWPWLLTVHSFITRYRLKCFSLCSPTFRFISLCFTAFISSCFHSVTGRWLGEKGRMSKSEPSWLLHRVVFWLYTKVLDEYAASILRVYHFNPDNRCSMFHWNISTQPEDCTVQQPRGPQLKFTSPWRPHIPYENLLFRRGSKLAQRLWKSLRLSFWPCALQPFAKAPRIGCQDATDGLRCVMM